VSGSSTRPNGDGDSWREALASSGEDEFTVAEEAVEAAECLYDRLLYEEGQQVSELRDLKDYKLEGSLRKLKRLADAAVEGTAEASSDQVCFEVVGY
jgi:hypothetical protein